MGRKWCFVLLMASVLLGSGSQTLAAHGGKKEARKAILLVAFGTSDPEAQKTFLHVEEEARKRFPGVELRWAFTSGMIRKKLAKEGKALDSPEVALARLMEAGFTHVAVLSLPLRSRLSPEMTRRGQKPTMFDNWVVSKLQL